MPFSAIIAASILALAAHSDARGSTSWQWQHPRPTGATLRAIVAADRDRCLWAVGDGGTIIASRDSARTWSAQASPRRVTLNGVAAVSTDRLWAVGDSGVVLTSEDGGGRWTVQQTGVYVNLTGIAMLDARFGWVVGDGGVILATTDGGGRWVPQYHRAGALMSGVASLDRNRAVVIGWREGAAHGEAFVVRTEDGGQTWTERSFGPGYRFTAVRYDGTRRRLWIVGKPETRNTPPLVTESQDGGVTWKGHRIDQSGALQDVIANHDVLTAVGVAETGRAWVLQSSDGGGTWRSELHPVSGVLYSVVGDESGRLVAVGQGGTIVGPGDIGRRMPSLSVRGNLTGIAFTNVRRGCAVGDGGLILCTNDSGSHWSMPANLLPAAYRAIAWTSRDVAYAVAEGGIIVRTLDGGASWDVQPSTTETDLTGISARGEHVWVVGLQGFVMRSADRGNTWSAVREPASETLVAVEISPSDEVFALSATGELWTTTLDGARWRRIDTGLEGQATTLAVTDRGTMFVGGIARSNTAEGLMLRTDDGGRTWTRTALPVAVEDIAFASPNDGVLVGGSAVFTTNDGGRTWTRLDIPTQARLHGADAAGGFVWTAGDLGTIIRCEP